MAAKERFGGCVRGGRVVLDNSTHYNGAVARLEGKRVTLTVAKEKKARSLTVNAYLWGVVYQTIAEWSGHDAEEIHEALKEKFLPEQGLLLPTGEELKTIGSTARLDSVDFSDYVAKVKRWAAENGVYVPEPGEIELEPTWRGQEVEA